MDRAVRACMECRSGCGACCIALSISSPIPGMPDGKPAGVRCAQLTDDNRCAIFGEPERPEVCNRLRPSEEMCGTTAEEAYERLALLELATVGNPHDLGDLFTYLRGASTALVRRN